MKKYGAIIIPMYRVTIKYKEIPVEENIYADTLERILLKLRDSFCNHIIMHHCDGCYLYHTFNYAGVEDATIKNTCDAVNAVYRLDDKNLCSIYNYMMRIFSIYSVKISTNFEITDDAIIRKEDDPYEVVHNIVNDMPTNKLSAEYEKAKNI